VHATHHPSTTVITSGEGFAERDMDIIFAFMVFHFSSDLPFKSELSEEIQLNELNLIVIANTFIIVPK
jgi:hypothetical protein